MLSTLQALQLEKGAVFHQSETATIADFGQDQEALTGTQMGVALYDCSHWGRIEVRGADRIRFLHNQTTNDFNRLHPGHGCDTVFVTSTARTLDLVSAYLTEDRVILLVSPSRRQSLISWMDRYLFPMDQVELKDITEESAAFRLIGPQAFSLLTKLGVTGWQEQPLMSHKEITVPELGTLRVAVGCGLSLPGITVITPAPLATTFWQRCYDLGAIPFGETLWEQLRIQQGRPAPERELTEDYNPLEARLWQTISFEKGCYIGQETIARLHTYKGVKQELWGVRLTGTVAPGTPVILNEEKVGKLTSVIDTPDGPWGLAYIRTKTGGAGLTVQIGNVTAEVVDVPFLSHQPE